MNDLLCCNVMRLTDSSHQIVIEPRRHIMKSLIFPTQVFFGIILCMGLAIPNLIR